MQAVHSTSIPYYLQGTQPHVLIISGIHGDEFRILPIVREVVEELSPTLPDFLYIPVASPSAVNAKNRLNAFGHDLNRRFYEIDDPEAVELRKILSTFSLTTRLSFHEDLEFQDHFYMYDSAELPPKEVDKIRQEVTRLGIPLYSGIDEDGLATVVTNGYVANAGKSEKTGHFLEDWVPEGAALARSFTFEIPCTQGKEKDLIRLSIEFVLSLRLPR